MRNALFIVVLGLIARSPAANCQAPPDAMKSPIPAPASDLSPIEPSTNQVSITNLMGKSREQAEVVLGKAQQCYEPRSGRHLQGPEECLPAQKAYPRIWDVFFRKENSNEYEIRIAWDADATASRLHPTARLGAAWFVMDRPVTLYELLPSLLEARDLCRGGCKIRVEWAGKTEVVVFPEVVDRDTMRVASLAANGWRKEPDSMKYRFGLVCWWSNDRPLGKQMEAIDIAKLRIEECQIRPYDPEFALEMARISHGLSPKPVDLAPWKP